MPVSSLGQFRILLKLLPIEAKSIAIGANLAIVSLVAAIAPITGGAILTWTLGRWPDPLVVHHVCFLVQPVLALLGAMRNIRTLSGVFGLGAFVNYVFYRPQKDEE